MATFYPQILSNESLSQQWQRYLQNKPLINNVEDIIENQTKEYKDIIEHSTSQQIQALESSTEAICGSLNDGFELLSDNLHEISYGIGELRSELNQMSSMLDWKLSLFIEQQRISNLLLGNLAVLLRIPDIQKERQYYIEQGIKFLKNSYFDSDFFQDSLNNLLKAETIEPSDFFALHRIGLIYMYSQKHLDLQKAEEYFRKAAKYAVAETNSGSGITTNFLATDINKNLLSQVPTIDSIKLQAAESYLFAGRSCYIQGKFSEAAELASKSFSLVPTLAEAGYTQAKALSADNKVAQASTVIRSVIKVDRFYSIKVVTDLDLSPKQEIKDVLERIRQETYNEAINLLSECKRNMVLESMVIEEITGIENLISRKSFLHCKKAIDLINKKETRAFSDITRTDNIDNYKENRNIDDLNNSLNVICKKVKYPGSYISKIKILFDFLSENTQWNFPNSLVTVDLGFNNKYESKKINSSIIEYLKQEKEYFDKLVTAKALIAKVLQEIDEDDTKRRNDDDLRDRQKKQDIQNKKNINSIKYATGYLFAGAGYGAVFGLVIAFFRSCNPDHLRTNTFFLPGVFLPTWITIIIIGAVIGAIAGYIKGQNEN